MAGFAPLIARSGAASAATAKRAAAEQPKKKTPAVRPKLKVSDPSEPMERDADRAADRVMRQAPPSFPMAGPARQQMESGFGQSFDGVRVHRDGAAAGLADSISARAFTLGNDVFFGAGQYQPHTPDGRRLIAHEFAHVVQGSDGRVAQPSL